MTPDQIIARFGLARHPEGGHYRQTWVAHGPDDQRPAGTAILFLLQAGEVSHWHKVDADEIWHYYAGSPLALRLSGTDQGPARRLILGPDLHAGEGPQIVVPAHHWQTAESLGAWTLVGCTVSPGFRFDGFTLAPPGFDIPGH